MSEEYILEFRYSHMRKKIQEENKINAEKVLKAVSVSIQSQYKVEESVEK